MQGSRAIVAFDLDDAQAADRLTRAVDFWDTSEGTVPGYPWFNFYADVGTYRDGRCDASASGSVLTHLATPDDSPGPPQPPDARVVGGATVAGTFSLNASSSGWEFAFHDPALARRGYTCVMHVRTVHNNRAQPDPDTGSWTRLPSNFTMPAATDVPPGPGDYYYYVTEIDKATAVSARSAVVRVTVPGPAGPASSGQPPGGTSEAPVIVSPAAGPGRRAVSRVQARRRTKHALRRAYRKRFRDRTRYRASCRRDSAAKWTCRVAWRSRGQRFAGSVVVRLNPGLGYATTVLVHRR